MDGADEVDPNLDLIKGYGRALVREKIVAASSRRLVILVGDEKLVPRLGTRGQAARRGDAHSPCRCASGGCANSAAEPVPYEQGKRPVCDRQREPHSRLSVEPITDAPRLEMDIRAIPGVVGNRICSWGWRTSVLM